MQPGRYRPTDAEDAVTTPLRIGGDEHRDLFCREFVRTHEPYEPASLDWPTLDDGSLARLRSLPFWGEAVSSERTAAARVQAMADDERDPIVREAVALQGYEEARHAQLLDRMLAAYGIDVPADGSERPRDPEWGFLRMGYGECFDSFFAFGLFRVASDTGFFPPALVRVFDGVMQEEARHILFFANWAAHRQVQLPPAQRPWFLVRRGLGVLWQAFGRVKTALQLRDAEAGDDFTMQVPDSIGDVTLARLATICLQENERRLAPYDPRLLRPKMVPTLVGLSMRFVPGARAS
jgi:hypothetical protein